MSKPFQFPVRVYYEDTDAQGVVYYANYFCFMERARTEWLEAMGVDHASLLQEQDRILVVSETHARFLSPARLGDRLLVTAELSRQGRASFGITQNIYRIGKSEGEQQLLVEGGVTAACLEASTMKPKRIPNTFFKDTTS